jgi:type IV pilus assembly protein PilA
MSRQRNSGFTLVEIMIVVVIIGLLAMLAVPGFLKMRASSQDKAVLSNARQLASAADQYFMANGVSFAEYDDLVGTSAYVRFLHTVASETYPTGFTAGVAITITGIGGLRTINYGL